MTFSILGITYGSLVKDYARTGRVIELPTDQYGSYTILSNHGNAYTIAGYNVEVCNWQGFIKSGDSLLVTDGKYRVVVTVINQLDENNFVVIAPGVHGKWRIHRSQIIGKLNDPINHKFTVYQEK